MEPVKRSGAEYFVIDAGWYADDGDWWEDVGAWEPSKRRFPSGFDHLLGPDPCSGPYARFSGSSQKFIGVRCQAADDLPHEAFLQRDGHRIVERGRYHLDIRHPRFGLVWTIFIDRCVIQHGAVYSSSTTISSTYSAPISTALGRRRTSAAQQSVSRVGVVTPGPHPDLVIENCSSGGMRMDYAYARSTHAPVDE